MGRSSRQKINKETVPLNNAVYYMELIDIFRTFHANTAKHTFFSSAHGTFSRIGYMLGHKTSLNKFKNIVILSSISNHNGMKLEINYKKKTETLAYVVQLVIVLSHSQKVMGSIPGQSTYLDCRFDPRSRHVGFPEQTHMGGNQLMLLSHGCFSLSLPLRKQ